jgi:hypothetical protein
VSDGSFGAVQRIAWDIQLWVNSEIADSGDTFAADCIHFTYTSKESIVDAIADPENAEQLSVFRSM